MAYNNYRPPQQCLQPPYNSAPLHTKLAGYPQFKDVDIAKSTETVIGPQNSTQCHYFAKIAILMIIDNVWLFYI